MLIIKQKHKGVYMENKSKVNFDQSETKINLARAFAGECQDGARYQFIAKQAEQEGYQYIKTLLKTLAKNEMAHAKTFFDLINQHCTKSHQNIQITGGYPFECGNLNQNLKDSIETEISQSDNVYPSFAQVARDEGFEVIAKKFEYVASVENCHHLLLTQVLEKLKSGKLYKSPTPKKWKCSECGFEHTAKQSWEICPSCEMPKGCVEISIDTGE